MQVKLKEIIKANATITIILNTKMRAATAFKFRKVLKLLDDNLDIFNTTKQDIIAKFKLEADNKDNLVIPNDISKEVNDEFNELLNQEINIGELNITIDYLKTVDLTPTLIDSIYGLFK